MVGKQPSAVEYESEDFKEAIERFEELLRKYNDSQLKNIVTTIAFNPDSQVKVISIRNSARETLERQLGDVTVAGEIERIQQRSHRVIAHGGIEARETSSAKEIRRLSTFFADKFPPLVHHFRNWIPQRQELISEAKSCANKLDISSLLSSMFRILTSTADVVATQMRSEGSKNEYVPIALKYGIAVSILSLFIHLTVSKRLNNKIKILMEEDQEKFKPIKQWFQQSAELDAAVRRFFPYGIDQDLVLAIDKSAVNSDEYTKLFMSVIASNAKEDIELFKDREFLDKADKFSTSESGIIWYRKVLMENNPVYIEFFKCGMEEDIKSFLKKIEDNSKKEKPEDITSLLMVLSSKKKVKYLLNGMLIYSAACNILDGGKSEGSRILRKLADKTNKELESMKTVLHLLTPKDTKLDCDS